MDEEFKVGIWGGEVPDLKIFLIQISTFFKKPLVL